MTRLREVEDLDAAVALLYAHPPSGFVGARSALVKELKAAKRKDDAARVAALRRPTKLAWALGEAVRRSPEAAEDYFAAIGSLGEPGGDLRQRTADLRDAVGRLGRGAEGLSPGDASAALLATAADAEATAALRLGRLADVPAAGGFGVDRAEDAPTGQVDRRDPEGTTGGEVVGSTPPEEELPAAGADAEAAEGERREREEREEEDRARAERIAALAAEHAAADAAEAEAASTLEAARVAVDEAQSRLDRARSEHEAARKAARAVAERLREAEG